MKGGEQQHPGREVGMCGSSPCTAVKSSYVMQLSPLTVPG